MIVDPEQLIHRERHKLLIGAILPRPIAWVSTVDKDGAFNLAPYSFFTVGASNPMTLIFCPQVPADSDKVKKDTLRNIEEVPEFVVNITNEDTAQAMNLSATPLPHGRSEFDWAGLTALPGTRVRAPRVVEAPLSFECKLQRIVEISPKPGGGVAVFGEVVLIHLHDNVYDGNYVILDELKPIGRLAGASYTRVTDTFEMERVPPPATG